MIQFEEEVPKRKEGCYIYTECPICEDLSWCEICSREFCINQHKDEDGKETQPESLGVNMIGKKWEETPKGLKWIEKKLGRFKRKIRLSNMTEEKIEKIIKEKFKEITVPKKC